MLKSFCEIRDFFYFLSRKTKLCNYFPIAEVQDAKKLVLFILPKREIIGGGVLSIFSIAKYTKRLLPDYRVFFVTEKGKAQYDKITWFDNDEKIFKWERVIRSLSGVDRLLIHIPEFMTRNFYDRLSKRDVKILRKVPHLQINILNQNSKLLSSVDDVKKLFRLTDFVTQTVAFERDVQQSFANKYNMPITFISSFLDLSKYKVVPFEEKEKLIVLSPDVCPVRDSLIDSLKKELSDYRIEVVNNMSFENYMDLISRAFAVITLGEGFDGYLLQPSIVKTLSFAVYNSDFFPDSEFLNLMNIYKSYDDLMQNIIGDITELSLDKEKYYTVINELRRLDNCHSEEIHVSLLNDFYNQKYNFIPQ